MFDFNTLLNFSHTHCVSICSALVPLNLLGTLQTLLLTGYSRPMSQIWKSAGFAIACALLMALHVLTWFIIGVIMIQTFVLLSLGLVCLGLNLWAVWHPSSMKWILEHLIQHTKQSLRAVFQGV